VSFLCSANTGTPTRLLQTPASVGIEFPRHGWNKAETTQAQVRILKFIFREFGCIIFILILIVEDWVK
jgi:hypothetical protein